MFTIRQAAEQLGLNYQQLWYAIITKKLRAPEKVGSRYVVTHSDLLHYRHFFCEKVTTNG